jgi:YD repeat-containing protein
VYYSDDGTTTIVDPLNVARVQTYATTGTRKAFAGQSQPCVGCAGDAAAATVDPVTGLTTQQTDYLGIATLFTWDTTRKLQTSMTRAAGRPESQAVQTQWHPTWRLPLVVTEEGRSTTYTYDDQGNKTGQVVVDITSGVARSWSWTYGVTGLPATMKDARGGVWVYAYDQQGNLATAKDPLGRVTAFTYDAAGRLLSQTDPNGLVHVYAYDLRGRLISESHGDEATQYSYTPTGKLWVVTFSSGPIDGRDRQPQKFSRVHAGLRWKSHP